MKTLSQSPLRLYGIFIAVASICFCGIIAGFLLDNAIVFWVSIILFALFGITRILIILRLLKSENINQISRRMELQKERSKLLTLMNSLGEAVLAVNTLGEITLYNSAALELIDSHTEPNGEKLGNVLKLVDSKSQSIDIIEPIVKEGKVIARDDLLLDLGRGHDAVPIYLLLTPINEQGEIVGAIIMARDISKQKNLQAQKDEFLSVVSHELRTPVAIVEADLSTVLLPGYSDLNQKAEKLLRSAKANITYLSGLLQDISDLSHAERLVLDVELQSVDCVGIAKELADDFKLRAEKENLELKIEIDEPSPSVISSTQRINEILVNFLTNAIKYSSGVGKTVGLRLMPSEQFEDGVRFEISDQGLGISADDQAKLFKKFFRSTSSDVQAIKGTGMGLYITSQQAKKIGAVISLSSDLGKGSTFALDIPARVPAELVAKTSS